MLRSTDMYNLLVSYTLNDRGDGDGSTPSRAALTEALCDSFDYTVSSTAPVQRLTRTTDSPTEPEAESTTRYSTTQRRVVIKMPPRSAAQGSSTTSAAAREPALAARASADLQDLLTAYNRYVEHVATRTASLVDHADSVEHAVLESDEDSSCGSSSGKLGATVVLAGCSANTTTPCLQRPPRSTQERTPRHSGGGTAGDTHQREVTERFTECSVVVGAHLSSRLFPPVSSSDQQPPRSHSESVATVRAALLHFVKQKITHYLLASLEAPPRSSAQGVSGQNSRRSTPRMSATVSSSPRQRDDNDTGSGDEALQKQQVSKLLLLHWLWFYALCGLSELSPSAAETEEGEPLGFLLSLAESLTRDYVTRQRQKGYVDILINQNVFFSHRYAPKSDLERPRSNDTTEKYYPFLLEPAPNAAALFANPELRPNGLDNDDKSTAALGVLDISTLSTGSTRARFGSVDMALPSRADVSPLRVALMTSGRMGQSMDAHSAQAVRTLMQDPSMSTVALATPPASGRAPTAHGAQQLRLARAEKTLASAKKALQFAVKLGALYGTQDINALLPFLPTTTTATADAPPASSHSPLLAESAFNENSPRRGQYGSGSPSKEQPYSDAHGSFVRPRRSPFLLLNSASSFARGNSQHRLLARMESAATALLEGRSTPHAAVFDEDTVSEVGLILTLLLFANAMERRRDSQISLPERLWLYVRASGVVSTFANAALTAAVRQSQVLADCVTSVLTQLQAWPRGGTPAPSPPLPNEESAALAFSRVWLAHFDQTADTTKHLLRAGHRSPRTMESIVWYLADLAHFFRALKCQLLLPPPPLSPGQVQTLQDSTLLPAEHLMRALVGFMDALAVSMDSADDDADDDGDQKRHRFVYASCELEGGRGSSVPSFNDLYKGDDACAGVDSPDAAIEGVSTAYGPGSTRSVLCVHYFLDFLDTLLEVSLAVACKPLFLTSLLVDIKMKNRYQSLLNPLGTVPPGATFLTSSGDGAHAGGAREAEPGALQGFIDQYCNTVLQKAVDRSAQEANNPDTGRAPVTPSKPHHHPQRHPWGLSAERPAGSFPTAAEGDTDRSADPLAHVWPCDPFSTFKHFARVSEHVRLVSEYFADRSGCPSGHDPHGTSQRVLVSGLTAVLDTAGGSCTQLLSLPCSPPHPGHIPTSFALSPQRLSTGLARLDAPSATASGGLRLRIWMLQLLATAAMPLSAEHRDSFVASLSQEARRCHMAEDRLHYDTLGALLSRAGTALPHQFSTTYVRLIFLRLVQSFYSVPSSSPSALQVELFESTRSAEEDPLAGSLHTTDAAALWPAYVMELLRTMRVLCLHHMEAHGSALKLSVPSVFARLLQNIEVLGPEDGGPPTTSPQDHELDDAEPDGAGRNTAVTPMPKNFVDFEDFNDESANSGGSEGAATPSDADADFEEEVEVKEREAEAGEKEVIDTNEAVDMEERVGSVEAVTNPPSPPPPASLPAGTLPLPPLIPKLSLGTLGPPLYFLSNGETGAAQEEVYIQKKESVDSVTATPAVITPGEVDDEEQTFTATASPTVAPTTVFPPMVALPKLSFQNLAPPLYYTSSGDTGLFGEVAQQQQQQQQLVSERPVAITTTATTAAVVADDTSASSSGGNRNNSGEKDPVPLPVSQASSLREKQAVLSGRQASAGSGANSRRDPTNMTDSPRVVLSVPEPLKLNSLLLKASSPRREETAREHPVPAVLQRVPAATCAELVLCLCGLILHRQSGAIQHAFTVSSLTQRRFTPSTSRHPARFVDRGAATKEERVPGGDAFRHRGGASAEPQGASAFHVVKSIYTFLLKKENYLVCRELQQYTTAHYEDHQLRYLHSFLDSPAPPAAECPWAEESPLLSGMLVILRLLVPRWRWLKQFDVLRRLGSGGYGSVVLVTHNAAKAAARPACSRVEEKERAVLARFGRLAIKLMPLRLQGSETGSLPVCHMEALAMHRLQGHPHISSLLSFGCTGTEYAIVMPQYVGGSVLEWRIQQYPPGYAALSQESKETERRRGFTLLSVCGQLFLQLLEAVEYTHRNGLRHGDIKAANLFIEKVEHVAGGSEDDEVCLASPKWGSSGSSARGDGKTTAAAPTYTIPTSIRLGDFGSCDACENEDMVALISDLEAGEGRFMAGRWGSGRGTEAIQPPELMNSKRRYSILRTVLEAHYGRGTVSGVLHRVSCTSGAAAASGGETGERSSKSPSQRVLAPKAASGASATELCDRLRQIELSVDMWACGCLLYEMLTGRMLFGDARLGRLMMLGASTLGDDGGERRRHSSAGEKDEPSVFDEWDRQDLERSVGPEVLSFLSALLSLDPARRPTAEEALVAWRHIVAHNL